MSILDYLFGGGSMAQNVKQGNQQMSVLQALGLSDTPQYDAPIGAMPNGQPMPSSMIDPAFVADQKRSTLADFGNKLSTWGAGVSKASGPSRMPIDFGQAMAGGSDALQAGRTSDMDNQLKQAQIEQAKAKAMPDFEQQAQQIMMKKQMGIPLSPQEEALAGTYDAFQNKMQTITLPNGNIVQVPAQRPVFGQIAGGRATPQGGGQMTRPTRPPLESFVR